MAELSRDLEDIRTIPLANDLPDHGGRNPTAENGVEFGVTCREGLIRDGQERLEWTRRLRVFAADLGYDLVYLVGRYSACTGYVARCSQKDVRNVSKTTWTTLN